MALFLNRLLHSIFQLFLKKTWEVPLAITNNSQVNALKKRDAVPVAKHMDHLLSGLSGVKFSVEFSDFHYLLPYRPSNVEKRILRLRQAV